MNIVLFCRIVYVDLEAVIPSKLSSSKCDLKEDIEIVKQQTQIPSNGHKDVKSNEDCDDFYSAQTCEDSSITYLNQNFVNGCQKRKEWTHESIARD